MPAADGLGPLADIKHIVVLMMENRSFDQMLGYLALDDWKLDVGEVDGLVPGMSCPDDQGVDVPIHEFGPGDTAFTVPGNPFDHALDPDHSPIGVAAQLAGGNKGFVTQFIEKRNPPADRRNLVMGYYTGEHLPVYDHLARNFCVCDAWHSSVPGDTWPNRQFALAGQQGDRITKRFGAAFGLVGNPIWDKIKDAPIYDVPAFPRHLRDEQWRWYSHDPGTLRAVDGRYRDFSHGHRDNFTYFDRKRVSPLTEAIFGPISTRDSFLDDAAKGQLRDVSWIDPNFVDLHVFDPVSNDDHPPSDVKAGQALVLDIYEALANSKDWDDTLLVIVYDEHGGFYDHVPPPAISPPDGSGLATYGVRVPALVVGPRVRQHVSHELFDHTSIIKTILRRFTPDQGAAALAAMPQRVRDANDLSLVLHDAIRGDAPDDRGDLHDDMDVWRAQARRSRQASAGAPSVADDGAGRDYRPHDFQQEFGAFAQAMRQAGLPGGQP
jgi:phospholipase C